MEEATERNFGINTTKDQTKQSTKSEQRQTETTQKTAAAVADPQYRSPPIKHDLSP